MKSFNNSFSQCLLSFWTMCFKSGRATRKEFIIGRIVYFWLPFYCMLFCIEFDYNCIAFILLVILLFMLVPQNRLKRRRINDTLSQECFAGKNSGGFIDCYLMRGFDKENMFGKPRC